MLTRRNAILKEMLKEENNFEINFIFKPKNDENPKKQPEILNSHQTLRKMYISTIEFSTIFGCTVFHPEPRADLLS